MTSKSNIQFSDTTGMSNQIKYAINQYMMQNVNTFLPCKILKVNGNSYTVEILTQYLDASGKPIKPLPIYDIPKVMLMGGTAGIIVELVEGDSVLVGFCQRDITTVKRANWTSQNPQTFRKFDLRDGIILAVLSNKLPSIYVKVTNNGIEIKGPKIDINIDGDAKISASKVVINSNDINLGGSGGSAVLTESTSAQFTGTVGGQPATGTITGFTGSSSTKATD